MNDKVKPAFSLEPLPGRIIATEDGFAYEGRIVIPERSQIRPTTAKVVSIGEGVKKVKVGDHIVFGQYNGTLIVFKGQPAYRVLTEDEILAKIHGQGELEAIGA